MKHLSHTLVLLKRVELLLILILLIPCFSPNIVAQVPTQIHEEEWDEFGEERSEDATGEEWNEHHEELFELDDPNIRGFYTVVVERDDSDYKNWNKHVDKIVDAWREGKDPLLMKGFVAGVLADTPASNPFVFVQLNDIELRHANEELLKKVGGESSIRLLTKTGSVFRAIAPTNAFPKPGLSWLGYLVTSLFVLLCVFMLFFIIWTIRVKKKTTIN